MQLPTSRSVRCAVANSRNTRSTDAYGVYEHSGLKILIEPLETDSKFVHSAAATAVCSYYKDANRAVCPVGMQFVSK